MLKIDQRGCIITEINMDVSDFLVIVDLGQDYLMNKNRDYAELGSRKWVKNSM